MHRLLLIVLDVIDLHKFRTPGEKPIEYVAEQGMLRVPDRKTL